MKAHLLIVATPSGKRIHLLEKSKFQLMLDADEIEQVKGNLYQTKVMLPGIALRAEQLVIREIVPEKPKRGRPRKARENETD